MENSIKKVLTEEDRVASVILAIQGHSVDKKQVVVVEGEVHRDGYTGIVCD